MEFFHRIFFFLFLLKAIIQIKITKKQIHKTFLIIRFISLLKSTLKQTVTNHDGLLTEHHIIISVIFFSTNFTRPTLMQGFTHPQYSRKYLDKLISRTRTTIKAFRVILVLFFGVHVFIFLFSFYIPILFLSLFILSSNLSFWPEFVAGILIAYDARTSGFLFNLFISSLLLLF